MLEKKHTPTEASQHQRPHQGLQRHSTEHRRMCENEAENSSRLGEVITIARDTVTPWRRVLLVVEEQERANAAKRSLARKALMAKAETPGTETGCAGKPSPGDLCAERAPRGESC